LSVATLYQRQRHVLAAAAHGVDRFIAAQGSDPLTLMSRAGLAPQQIENPCLQVDLGAYCRLMETAAAQTGNGNFGLWFGQQFEPEQLGLIGRIALASPTLGSALDNLARLFYLHQQVTETRFYQSEGLLRLEYRILDGHIVERRQDAELTLGMFANVLRRCLGRGWAPERVEFEHPRPGDWREHERAFDAPVYFGRRSNALVFRNRDLQRAMPGRDLAQLPRLCEELARVGGGSGPIALAFMDRVRSEIRASLSEGAPHIEAVAELLRLPRWTLQRRLAEHGYSYSDLVEEVRCDLAMAYLAQPQLPLADIASLLGYSEPSAFTRAFCRRYGVPPSRMRAQRAVVS